MARTSLLVAAIAVSCYVLVNVLVTTDRERVENEIERLVELARKGGEDAADELMAAFADDYRGSIDLEWIRRQVQNYVGRKKLRSVEIGSVKTVWKDDEILIPLLKVTLGFDGMKGMMLLTVTCAERDGKWKIVRVTRAKFG